MEHLWEEIPSFLSVWRPCAPVVWFLVNQGSGAWGAIEVWLKSKVPFSCEYAERLGFSIEGQRRLSVIYNCSRRWYEFCMGKYKPDMK